MDLSINRLKVLGEEEIQRLDLKITEYKNSNQPSVLDKSINDIKTQISDLSSICNDLETEISSKTIIFNQLQDSLKEYQEKYSSLNENILSIELSIQDHDKRKIELQSQFELMDETISRLRDEEQKGKISFEQLNIKLEQRKIQFKTEKEQIDNQIKLFELKIKELMQSSLTSHNNFIADVKSIELKQEVNDTQAIFDSIKFDLLTNLSRNIMNYSKDYCFKYFVKYEIGDFNNKKNYKLILETNNDYYYAVKFGIPGHKCIDLHKDILKCKGGWTNFHKDNYCLLCGCRGFKLSEQKISDDYHKNPEMYKYIIGERAINPEDQKKQMNKIINYINPPRLKWFEQNYDKILENNIIHPELLILIKKLCYQDFYSLFTSYEPFNINYVDSYQFLCFIAFIGTNGYNEKYMKLNELE